MGYTKTLILVCLAATTSAALAADPHLARNLAATCANCHGTDGKSVGGMAKLAGEPKARILSQLQDFRSGAKPATVMHQIARGYTEAQLELIAGYFAGQN